MLQYELCFLTSIAHLRYYGIIDSMGSKSATRQSPTPIPLAEVFHRIGVSEKKNAAWLLAFVQRDLTTMPERDWVETIQDIVGLASLASCIQPEAMARLTVDSDLDMMTASLNLQDGGPLRYCYPAQHHVQQLHAEVRRSVDELLAAGKTTLPPLTITLDLYRSVRGAPTLSRGTDPLSFSLPRHDHQEFIAAFWYRTARVLAACSHLILRCPMWGRSQGCQRLFVAGRRNQKWCRKECGSVIRTEKSRNKTKAKRERAANGQVLKLLQQKGRRRGKKK